MMTAFKTTLFIIAIPGSLLVVIPSTILQPLEKNALNLGIFVWLALPLWLLGLGMLVWCATDFVRYGRGTPAPVEAPKHLVGYWLCLWLAFHTFVLLYEEPHLRKTFGAEYTAYCQAVPRWLPNFRDRQPRKA